MDEDEIRDSKSTVTVQYERIAVSRRKEDARKKSQELV